MYIELRRVRIKCRKLVGDKALVKCRRDKSIGTLECKEATVDELPRMDSVENLCGGPTTVDIRLLEQASSKTVDSNVGVGAVGLNGENIRRHVHHRPQS